MSNKVTYLPKIKYVGDAIKDALVIGVSWFLLSSAIKDVGRIMYEYNQDMIKTAQGDNNNEKDF
jgi:hypothetical protein